MALIVCNLGKLLTGSRVFLVDYIFSPSAVGSILTPVDGSLLEG